MLYLQLQRIVSLVKRQATSEHRSISSMRTDRSGFVCCTRIAFALGNSGLRTTTGIPPRLLSKAPSLPWNNSSTDRPAGWRLNCGHVWRPLTDKRGGFSHGSRTLYQRRLTAAAACHCTLGCSCRDNMGSDVQRKNSFHNPAAGMRKKGGVDRVAADAVDSQSD
ncbi:hypothetical protein PHSY_000107 [Pseudozyma hubeiensis SY62]|uniref:Uncharacterized protein n=1 Tax=Pseudozyma hubeiensis (strain SY62) TaxID=1305764 RepID=R9NVM4_PSEHS|nr:hypothetical protein PHSY_000107 [Pseudozyma hubeiensis SY62]GAC92553.1 hypothetical protein PHSY_000107 [Pseudozyma hubeiensis SY62]